MVDWTDTEFLVVLVFDIAAIVIAVWWISGRFTAKLREVEERKSRSSNDSEEGVSSPGTHSLTAAVHRSAWGMPTTST